MSDISENNYYSHHWTGSHGNVQKKCWWIIQRQRSHRILELLHELLSSFCTTKFTKVSSSILQIKMTLPLSYCEELLLELLLIQSYILFISSKQFFLCSWILVTTRRGNWTHQNHFPKRKAYLDFIKDSIQLCFG